ncbi:unnamed protein product, partial [Protopolystoma xenopodis]
GVTDKPRQQFRPGAAETTIAPSKSPISKASIRKDLSCYLYFLLAPTLIYRTSYPNTPRVNWHLVLLHLAQCVAFFASIFSTVIGSVAIVTLLFFGHLHAWQNAFAEMTRFADRGFYSAWWTSSNYRQFFRTWNILVQDWLYTYVFNDVRALLASRLGLRSPGVWKPDWLYTYVFNDVRALLASRLGLRSPGVWKPVCTGCVFLLSALWHEYILAVALGFVYPVMLVFFGFFGFLLYFVPTNANLGNVHLLTSFFLGNALLLSLYTMEWYARRNCPRVRFDWTDYVVPRSWGCLPPTLSNEASVLLGR